MKKELRKSIWDNLNRYDFRAKDGDFIEITEWTNGEGWDILIEDKFIQLSYEELEAINFLTKALDIKDEIN